MLTMKCRNCGNPIDLDIVYSKEVWSCPHCKTVFKSRMLMAEEDIEQIIKVIADIKKDIKKIKEKVGLEDE